MGDDNQAIKAGILEIADIFVINKADHPGADRLQADLEYMLSLVDHDRPKPEIVRTIAIRGEGVAALRDRIETCLAAKDKLQRLARRRERAEARFLTILSERLLQRALRVGLSGESLEEIIAAIAERRLDPYSAAERLVERLEVR